MATIAFSVPSGSHHRAFLQPIRDILIAQTDWQFLVISPGAPWADTLFSPMDYPRDRFAFTENASAEEALQTLQPSLVITTTTGLDPKDPPTLEAAKHAGIRTVTFVESWDNIWKMERIAKGLGRPGQRVVLPDHLIVWNEIMREHALRVFPELSLTSEAGDAGWVATHARTDGQGPLPPSPIDSRGMAADRSVGGPAPRQDPLSRVFVTGSPRLDYFGPRFSPQLPSREDVMRTIGLTPPGRFLHLATTELYDHGHVARAIAEGKRSGMLPADLQFYASVHPGGKMERHQAWASSDGFAIRFSPGRHEPALHPDFRYNPTQAEMLLLAGVFKYANVTVNLSSTVALESCVADRPVICAFFGKPFDWWSWRRSMVVRDFREHYADLLRGGGIAVARNPGQLVAQIRAYLENPEKDREGRLRSAELIATTIAGDACQRVLNVLRHLTT